MLEADYKQLLKEFDGCFYNKYRESKHGGINCHSCSESWSIWLTCKNTKDDDDYKKPSTLSEMRLSIQGHGNKIYERNVDKWSLVKLRKFLKSLYARIVKNAEFFDVGARCSEADVKRLLSPLFKSCEVKPKDKKKKETRGGKRTNTSEFFNELKALKVMKK